MTEWYGQFARVWFSRNFPYARFHENFRIYSTSSNEYNYPLSFFLWTANAQVRQGYTWADSRFTGHSSHFPFFSFIKLTYMIFLCLLVMSIDTNCIFRFDPYLFFIVKSPQPLSADGTTGLPSISLLVYHRSVCWFTIDQSAGLPSISLLFYHQSVCWFTIDQSAGLPSISLLVYHRSVCWFTIDQSAGLPSISLLVYHRSVCWFTIDQSAFLPSISLLVYLRSVCWYTINLSAGLPL